MSIDLRGAMRAALDVGSQPPSLEKLRLRAVAQACGERRRRMRAMFAAAVMILAGALVAGGSTVDASTAHVAAVPAPAPVPLST